MGKRKNRRKSGKVNLRQLCSKSFRTVYGRLRAISGVYEISPGLLHRDVPGCKVLGVAHLDVAQYPVNRGASFDSCKTAAGDTIVHSPALDDRLGVHALVNVLPARGIELDWLFTVDEEIARSTAEEFPALTDKDYNWIVEFDRRGTDVVLYQYEDCPGLVDALADAGFSASFGSYSDIVELDSLGCGAFNVGVGYHREHTDLCWASMGDFLLQIERFRRFYEVNKDRRFEFTPDMVPRSNLRVFGSGWSHGGCWWEDSPGWREGAYEDEDYHFILRDEYEERYNDPFYFDADPIVEADPKEKKKGR